MFLAYLGTAAWNSHLYGVLLRLFLFPIKVVGKFDQVSPADSTVQTPSDESAKPLSFTRHLYNSQSVRPDSHVAESF